MVAEGVETDEQLQALRALGCQAGQGFLFCRPLDEHDLTKLLARAPLWNVRGSAWERQPRRRSAQGG